MHHLICNLVLSRKRSRSEQRKVVLFVCKHWICCRDSTAYTHIHSRQAKREDKQYHREIESSFLYLRSSPAQDIPQKTFPFTLCLLDLRHRGPFCAACPRISPGLFCSNICLIFDPTLRV